MQLRRWKYEDILKISELEKECFPQEPWSYQMLVSSFENANFIGLLAEDGGEIIGYGGITLVEDTADIENIAVSEPYRNSGVGTEILNGLLNTVSQRGVKKVFLEVRVSNSVAMKLYLKSGFIGSYTRSRYYTDGEDCLVMVKEL